MSFDRNSIVRRSPDHVSAEMRGELVLMSVENGRYYGMNTVGTFIWDRMVEPTPVRDIVAALCARYAVDPGRGEADVLALLETMAAEGLVERAD